MPAQKIWHQYLIWHESPDGVELKRILGKTRYLTGQLGLARVQKQGQPVDRPPRMEESPNSLLFGNLSSLRGLCGRGGRSGISGVRGELRLLESIAIASSHAVLLQAIAYQFY